MGKKAKIRKQKHLNPETEFKQTDPNQFIQQIERQGYNFKKITQAPDLPENKIEPQI
jgi:hypothetical protein